MRIHPYLGIHPQEIFLQLERGWSNTGTLETRVQISAVPLLSKKNIFYLTKLLELLRNIIFSLVKKIIKRGEETMASKKLTRFERARIIGARALQLSMGANPMVDVTPDQDPIDIATLELKKNVLPLDVRALEVHEKAI